MAAAEGFDFAAEAEVFFDLIIGEYAEAVDDGEGFAGIGDDILGLEVKVFGVWDGKYQSFSIFQHGWEVFFYAEVFQTVLITEEPGPGVTGSGIGVLGFKFIPMVNIGIVYPDLSSHLGELAYDHLTAAVTGVADILTVAGTTNYYISSGDITTHVSQGIAH